MVNTAAFDAFSTDEVHATTVPLYRHEKEMGFLMSDVLQAEHEIARCCLE
jgi:hypothetical protein